MRFFKNLLPQTAQQALVSFSVTGMVTFFTSTFSYLATLQQDHIRYLASLDNETFNNILNALPAGFSKENLINLRNATPIPNLAFATFVVVSSGIVYFWTKSLMEESEAQHEKSM